MRLAFIALLLIAATQVDAAAHAVDQVYLLSRPAAIGNINRAKIDKRELPAGRMNELLGPSIRSAAEGCAAPLKDGFSLEPIEMPDRVGFTNTRFVGAGLYVSMPDAGISKEGYAYIAPYLSFDLKANAPEAKVLPLRLFKRYDLGTNDFGNSNFLELDTAALENTVKAYADKAIPAAVAEWTQNGCGAR